MQINLIWAQARNRVIGKDGSMPWHLPEDLAHLKRSTLGCPVIMGRKTWDSIPPKFRPLPGRDNIVLTRQANWQANGALPATTLREALLICERIYPMPETVWVIGGAQIYAAALARTNRIYLTRVHGEIDGDLRFPEIELRLWQTTRRMPRQVSSSGLAFEVVQLDRL